MELSVGDHHSPRFPRWSRLVRSWRTVLGASVISTLLATEIFYLVAANGFLHSSYFDSVVNGNSDKILVTTHSAYSLFPGQVHAAQIQVRGQDASTQWLITLENAQVSMSLTDLLRRHKLHFNNVAAKGGSFRLRSRNLAEKHSLEEITELPPISGLDADTLLKSRSNAEKLKNEISDLKEKNEPKHPSGLSEIKIDQVDIPGLTQLWVNADQFNGKIDVTGSFTLTPGHRLEIPDARLEIRSGALVRQGRSIAQNLNGSIGANIHDFELNRDHGTDIFKRLSGTISLRGRLDALDPFAFVLKSQDWFRLQKTEGNFSIDATARDGQLISVRSATLVADHLLASFSHFVVQGAAKIGFTIDHIGTGRFEFSLPTCQILSEKDRSQILDGSNLRIVVQSPDLEFAHLYKRVLARVILPHSRIANFQFLNRWIPHSSHLSVEEGSGQVDADLTVSNYLKDRPLPGKISIATEGLKIKNGNDIITGKVTILARVEQISHESTGEKELKITDTALQVTGALANAPKSWTTDIKISNGSIRPDDFPVLRADVELHIPDVSPFLSEFGVQKGLGKFAQNMLLRGNFEGTTSVTLSDGWFDLDDMKLTSDGARMLGLIHLRGDVKQALAVIHYGILSAGIELENDETHFRLEATDNWYKENSLKYTQAELPHQDSAERILKKVN